MHYNYPNFLLPTGRFITHETPKNDTQFQTKNPENNNLKINSIIFSVTTINKFNKYDNYKP